MSWSGHSGCLLTHADCSSALSNTDIVPALKVPAVLGRSFGEGGQREGNTTFTEEVRSVQEDFLQKSCQTRALSNFRIPHARPSGVWGPSAAVTPGCVGLESMYRGAQSPPTPEISHQSLVRLRYEVPQAPVNMVRDTGLLSLESKSQWLLREPSCWKAHSSCLLLTRELSSCTQPLEP